MAVYVDRAQIPARVGRHDARWSHLTADAVDELHEFAASLGLRRSYFQPGKPLAGRSSVAWYYDVTEGKRRQALRMGAQEIELGQWHEILGRRRAAQAESVRAAPRSAADARPDATRPPRLLVTGPRDVTDDYAVAKILRPRFSPELTLVTGGARGVDTISARLWREWGGQVEGCRVSPAEWAKSRGAGFARNARMVAKVKADHGAVLALEAPCADTRCARAEPHNTHGTSHCADLAEREGLQVDREPIATAHRAAGHKAAEEYAAPLAQETGAGEPSTAAEDARRTLAEFASERARSAWQEGNLVQAASLNRQCMDLDPGRGGTWRARAERIRAAADRAELGVTLAVRLALAGIEPDDPAIRRAASHNATAIARASGIREPEAGE